MCVILKLQSINRSNLVLSLFGAFWVSALAAFVFLTNYDFTPGAQGIQPSSWPSESRIVPTKNKFNAIVFLHPRCSCSLATANELAKVMTKAGDRLKVHVVIRPTQASAEASTSELSTADSDSLLVRSVDAIPGAVRTTDVAGREAAMFGAQTSGEVLLYGSGGNLLFAGGITASRGHEGDNAGAEAMLKVIDTSRCATVSSTPVFGCSLN